VVVVKRSRRTRCLLGLTETDALEQEEASFGMISGINERGRRRGCGWYY
jgi:hypothetical protein